MNEVELKKLSKKIFAAVILDFSDRKGLGDEWDQIDEEIQEEIKETNQDAIFNILKRGIK